MGARSVWLSLRDAGFLSLLRNQYGNRRRRRYRPIGHVRIEIPVDIQAGEDTPKSAPKGGTVRHPVRLADRVDHLKNKEEKGDSGFPNEKSC